MAINTIKRIVGIIGIFLFFYSFSIPLLGTTISFGQTVSESIAVGEVDTYTFSANAGNKVIIRMVETSSYSPYIRLYSPDGTELNNSSDSWCAEIISNSLPSTGTYTILASDHYGDYTGGYNLTLERLNPGSGPSISFGQTVSGNLVIGDLNTHTFSGVTGNRVVIRVNRTSGSISPQIRLYSPNGTELNESQGSSSYDFISESLSSTGTYTILASDSYGDDTGGYNITLERLNPGSGTSISFGQTVSGNFVVGDLNTYTFSGTAGNRVMIRMIETSSYSPYIRLYSPDGTELNNSSDSWCAEIISNSLPSTGIYTILASDHYGDYTGGFNLTLERLNPGSGPSISFGQTVSGNLVVGDLNTHTFSGVSGNKVVIRMKATSGSISPQIRVYKPDGTELSSSSLESSSNEFISDLLPNTGTYTILASDNYGDSAGGYNLTLERLNPGSGPSISFGQTVSGNLVVGDLNTHTFSGAAGNRVVIRISKTSGSLWPRIRLYSPDGTELKESWGFSDAEIISESLVNPGTYTILVSDYFDDYTGGYNLTLERLGATFELTQQVDKYFVWPGAELTYTTTYKNTGDADASNVVIEITLPSTLELVNGSISNGGTYNSTSRRINWNVGSLKVGAAAQSVTFKAIVVPGTANGTTITLTSQVSSTEKPEPTTASVTTTVALPKITTISPNKGGNAGSVRITIKGQYLDSFAEVRLSKTGQTDIIATNVTGSSQGTQLAATFDLQGKSPGIWNLVVINPGGGSSSLSNAFTIETGGEAKLWVEIVGSEIVRPGRNAYYQIVFGNKGSIDSFGEWVMIWIPKGFGYQIVIDSAVVASSNVSTPSNTEWVVLPVFVNKIESASSKRFDLILTPQSDAPSVEIGAAISHNLYSYFPDMVTYAPVQNYRTFGHSTVGISQSFQNDQITLVKDVLPDGKKVKVGDPIYMYSDGPKYKGQHIGIYLGNNVIGHHFFGGTDEITVSELFSGAVRENHKITYDRAYSAPPDWDIQFENITENWQKFNFNSWEYDPNGKGDNAKSCLSCLLDCWYGDNPISDKIPTGPCRDGTTMCYTTDLLKSRLSQNEPSTLMKVEGIFIQRVSKLEGFLRKAIRITTSIDPNDKAGPTGYDPVGTSLQSLKHFIVADHSLPYMVQFENLETATAAVQDMKITDQLDAHLNWSTFTFDAIQIGTHTIPVPAKSQSFTTTVDFRPEFTALVDVQCTFNAAAGKAQWIFRGKHPTTDQLTDFLPPNTNNNDPKGRGWVSYSVKPNSNLSTGKVIKNKATIDFEIGVPPAPMDTPEWINTIDITKPESHVLALSPTQNSPSFPVQWQGTDQHSGPGSYSIYVSDNGGSYAEWLSNTTQTSATFTGSNGHIYAFYSMARDNAGNLEDAPSSPDTFTTVSGSSSVIINLNRTALFFGTAPGNGVTPAQKVLISSSGGGSLHWTASPNQNWLQVSPANGTGNGVMSVSVDASGLSQGTYNGVITVTDPNASNSPLTINITLNVYPSGSSSIPFGDFSTPADGSTVRSSIPVTGWVLDDIGVDSVKIYRQEENSLVYIGDAVFIEGARPDVEQSYPGYPFNYRAGWGYMMLTNFLPNGGNGTFDIHAIAADTEGHQVTLGVKTIIVDNAHAINPFGAIDTPGQGGTASGSRFTNWGWALTPLPNRIPIDGSTINVWVDGINLGHPTYNIYREDIASLMPGYANSNGAAGNFYLDTTAYANGVHNLFWTAADDAGNADGIGSRYFMVQNTGNNAAGNTQGAGGAFEIFIGELPVELERIPVDYSEPVRFKKGFRQTHERETVYPDDKGMTTIDIQELERIELQVFQETAGAAKPASGTEYTGYLVVGNQLRSLPIGSTLDSRRGIFYWQPGPGFIGEYRLVFIKKGETGFAGKKYITVKIAPLIH